MDDTTGNNEINDALKQFETQVATTGGTTIPLDSGDSIERVPVAASYSAPSKMTERLMKYSGGIIKDERQAEYVLLGFVVVALGISFYLFFGGNHRSAPSVSIPAGSLPGTSVPSRTLPP